MMHIPYFPVSRDGVPASRDSGVYPIPIRISGFLDTSRISGWHFPHPDIREDIQFLPRIPGQILKFGVSRTSGWHFHVPGYGNIRYIPVPSLPVSRDVTPVSRDTGAHPIPIRIVGFQDFFTHLPYIGMAFSPSRYTGSTSDSCPVSRDRLENLGSPVSRDVIYTSRDTGSDGNSNYLYSYYAYKQK